MPLQSLNQAFPVFNDIDGQPLENGNIYIGTAGLAAATNQITVYWDEAKTIPATQPIRTIGGYLSNSGTPGNIYVPADDYSIAINNKNNSAITSALNTTERVGSSQITSDVNLTGSVERTVSSKLADTISVKDFGAVGDGVTDDTVAIQAAIDAFTFAASPALGEGGVTIMFPRGKYRITSTLNVANSGLSFEGDGPKSSIILSEVSGIAINYDDLDQKDIGYSRFAINKLAIRANSAGATSSGTGVYLDHCFDSVFHEVEIYNFLIGLNLDTCYFNVFDGCMFHTCPTGVKLQGGATNCVGNIFTGGSFRLATLDDESDATSYLNLDFEPMYPGATNKFGTESRVEACYFEIGYTFAETNHVIELSDNCSFRNNTIAFGTSSRPDAYIMRITGKNNKVVGNVSSYIDRLIQLDSTSFTNEIEIDYYHEPVASGANQYADNPILDLGTGNITRLVSRTGERVEEEGFRAGLTTVEGNQSFINYARNPITAQNPVNMTAVATTAVKDPFDGTKAVLCTTSGGDFDSAFQTTPNSLVANGANYYVYSAYFYFPTGTTMTGIIPLSGAYGQPGPGGFFDVASAPKDQWIKLSQISQPPSTTAISPGFLAYGPSGSTCYFSHPSLVIAQSPGVPCYPSIYEQSSDKRISWEGAWQEKAFDAADFGSGSGTLTVASGDVEYFRYRIKDNTMDLAIRIVDANLSGSNSATITVKIPEGRLAKGPQGITTSVYPAGGSWTGDGLATVNEGSDTITVFADVLGTGWLIGDNTFLFQMCFELQ